MPFPLERKETEIVLFSPLEGKLTYEGKPAANAEITLWIAWKDEQGESYKYQSDKNGFFKIPSLIVKTRQSPLAQLSVGQTIQVFYNNKEFLIWRAGKSNREEFGELGGEPLNLTCELTKSELDSHLEHALVKTSCTWSSIKK